MLVVGYGNTLRGDDGVGWAVAEALTHRRPGLDVRLTPSLVPELVADLAAADVVVFVDARAGGHPGHVRVESVGHDGDAGVSAHGLSPAALVDWCDRLFARRPRAFLVTVEGGRFAFGERLSPEVERAIPEAVAAIDWLWRDAAATRPVREPAPTAACSPR